MTPLTIQESFDLAMRHHQAGRLKEAEQFYRQLLLQQPDHAGTMHYLGVVTFQLGRNDEAMNLIRRAIAISPNWPEAHSNLGHILRESGQIDDAIAECRAAIALNGNLADAHNNLGAALNEKGEFENAIAALRQAIILKPDSAEAYYNLGTALTETGRFDAAVAAWRQTISLRPNDADAHFNIGITLSDKRDFDQAIAAFRQAIAFRPEYAEAHNNLGCALKDKGEFDQAIGAFRQAISIAPDFAKFHHNLGNALKDTGKLDEAIAAYQQAVTLNPGFYEAHGNLVYTLYYHPAYDAPTITEEHRRWSRQYAEPLGKFIQPHPLDRNPDRPLRIGYVSPDFRLHSVSFFLLPLLKSHDHRQFHVTCYTTNAQRDAVTDQIQSCADQWVSLIDDTDECAARRIREDRIDILIDLAGHTAGNRLLLFAHKPAPVQATYLGYPGTTGLTTIDWRLTDSIADPPGAEAFHIEKLFRLPRTAWCFYPLSGSPPIPPRQTQNIVFGCFNNLAKMNGPLLALWARILKKVPGSRLALKNATTSVESVQQWLRREMEVHGIAWDRIELMPRQPDVLAHLHAYDRIDIALDTYPYHGTTTTCEALWSGVPVVTLAGQTHASRVGVSLLTHVGLPNLIGQTPEQYVQIATELAADLPRLTELRSTLRRRMLDSPLMDAKAFARDVEAAYRHFIAKL